MKIKYKTLSDLEQAKRFIDACEPSVSGNKGSNQFFGVACHLVQNFPSDVAREALDHYNTTKCTPKWSGKELAHKWDDALKSGNLYSSPSAPTTTTPNVTGIDATIKHLETAFTNGEIVSLGKFVATANGKKVIQGPSMMVSELITSLRNGDIDLTEEPDGVAIRINPFKDVDSSRDADQIASFRHILIDFDLGTVDEQLKVLNTLALPTSVVVFSGKAGIHAWVKVDAKDKSQHNEYGEYLKTVLKTYPNVIKDFHIIDAPRFSRLAGFQRNGVEQSLYAVNLNTHLTFAEWQTKHEFPYSCHGIVEYIDGVKEDSNCEELIKNNFLTTESTSMLYAPAGQGKSTLAYQMAIQWSLGKPSFGLVPTKPLRSIFFQWEDTARKLKQFVKGITLGLNISVSDLKDVSNNVIVANRREVSSKNQLELYAMMESYIKKFRPNVFWLNPISAFFEGDLSDAQMVKQFRSKIDEFTMKYNLHVILVHHTAKFGKNVKTGVRYKEIDLQDAFGSSQFGWWIRSALCLEVSDKKPILNPDAPHVYALKAVKGAGDLEWKNIDGYDTNERSIGYSTDGNIYWIDYGQDTETKTAQKQRDKDEKKALIYAVLPKCELLAIDRDTISRKTKLAPGTVYDYLKTMDNVCKTHTKPIRYYKNLSNDKSE